MHVNRPLAMNTRPPDRTIPNPQRYDSLPASVIGESRPRSCRMIAPAASDAEICEALKMILAADLWSRTSTYRVHAAIAAIATRGEPSNTMLKANAQPGVTWPPSPKRNHRVLASPMNNKPQKMPMYRPFDGGTM